MTGDGAARPSGRRAPCGRAPAAGSYIRHYVTSPGIWRRGASFRAAGVGATSAPGAGRISGQLFEVRSAAAAVEAGRLADLGRRVELGHEPSPAAARRRAAALR